MSIIRERWRWVSMWVTYLLGILTWLFMLLMAALIVLAVLTKNTGLILGFPVAKLLANVWLILVAIWAAGSAGYVSIFILDLGINALTNWWSGGLGGAWSGFWDDLDANVKHLQGGVQDGVKKVRELPGVKPLIDTAAKIKLAVTVAGPAIKDAIWEGLKKFFPQW